MEHDKTISMIPKLFLAEIFLSIALEIDDLTDIKHNILPEHILCIPNDLFSFLAIVLLKYEKGGHGVIFNLEERIEIINKILLLNSDNDEKFCYKMIEDGSSFKLVSANGCTKNLRDGLKKDFLPLINGRKFSQWMTYMTVMKCKFAEQKALSQND